MLNLGPLATTTVGSFPRPSWLADVRRSEASFRMEGEALREAQEDATALVLAEQERIGLDLLTDGEQRRQTFKYHAAATWGGVDFETLGPKGMYRGRKVERMLPRIVGEVRRQGPAGVDEVTFAKSCTDRPLKMAVVGPMTMIDSTVDEFYGDEGALALDIADAVNAELRDLQAAGCDALQIDEPAMTRYHDKVFDYGARALDRCLDGITVPVFVHLCFGYPGGGSLQHEHEYPELLAALMETRIGGLAVEFGRSAFDPAVLKACGNRLVMFGCIDPGGSPVPAVEDVAARVEGALRYLSPDRVLLAPDCGLMTIGRAIARQKLEVMVAAAQSLRARL